MTDMTDAEAVDHYRTECRRLRTGLRDALTRADGWGNDPTSTRLIVLWADLWALLETEQR